MPGLFSKISGALAVAGASIVDARIHTMTNGMALDTFWIQDTAGGTFDAPHRLARLSVLIEQALSGRLRLSTEIRRVSKILLGRRMQAIHVPPRVVIDNRASNTHTVLEVNGRDRPGLLHDVTAAISDQGLQIASAHVTTYGVRAVDVFYVKDVFGLKVENERKLRQLREALLLALNNPDDVTPPVTVPPIRKLQKGRRAIGRSWAFLVGLAHEDQTTDYLRVPLLLISHFDGLTPHLTARWPPAAVSYQGPAFHIRAATVPCGSVMGSRGSRLSRPAVKPAGDNGHAGWPQGIRPLDCSDRGTGAASGVPRRMVRMAIRALPVRVRFRRRSLTQGVALGQTARFGVAPLLFFDLRKEKAKATLM